MSAKIPVAISFILESCQFSGVVGVIGSLIFVGLELRQSWIIALASQQQARTGTLVDIIGTFSYPENPANWEDMITNNLSEGAI